MLVTSSNKDISSCNSPNGHNGQIISTNPDHINAC
jgi:hypothetical protein